MSTKIEYQKLGEVITLQQINMLEDYDKIIYQDNLRKQKETFIKNELSIIEYYIQSGEDETTIVSELSVIVNAVVVTERVSISNYFMETVREYSQGVLQQTSKIIKTVNEFILCEHILYMADEDWEAGEIAINKWLDTQRLEFEFWYEDDTSFGGCMMRDSWSKDELHGSFDEIIYPGNDLPIDWFYFETGILDPTGFEV